MKQNHCPLCENSSLNLLFHRKLASIEKHDFSTDISQCSTCGHVFANDLLDESFWASYYHNFQKYDFLRNSTQLDKLRHKALAGFILTSSISLKSKICDLGCGDGGLIKELIETGFLNSFGFDPGNNCSLTAKKKYGITTVQQLGIQECVQKNQLADFDLIVMASVLEHIPNPKRLIFDLISCVKPSTKFVIEVPNLELFNETLDEPYSEFSIEHLHYFTIKALKLIFHTYGYGCSASASYILNNSPIIVALFEKAGPKLQNSQNTAINYIRNSEKLLKNALSKFGDKPYSLFGAGSLTARMLPRLTTKQKSNLIYIYDSNPNLIGKTIGGYEVISSKNISHRPDETIVVASYRYKKEITELLKESSISNIITF